MASDMSFMLREEQNGIQNRERILEADRQIGSLPVQVSFTQALRQAW